MPLPDDRRPASSPRGDLNMKDLSEIERIVLAYAQGQPLFITPHGENDPIVPIPEQMEKSQFNIFFSSLHTALAASGLRTHLRLTELRAVSTWADLAAIVYARQTA
jgi:hypothetical protein